MNIDKALSEWQIFTSSHGQDLAHNILSKRITEMTLKELQDSQCAINLTLIKHPELQSTEWSSVREFLLKILSEVDQAMLPALIKIRDILKGNKTYL